MRSFMRFGVLAFGLALAACSAAPKLQDKNAGQIVDVTVTQPASRLATRNLAEDVRVKVLNAAYRFSETGPSKALKVEIVQVRTASSDDTLLVSVGPNGMVAEVTMTDLATGASFRLPSVVARSYRSGGLIGAISTTDADPVAVEQQLASELAEAILRRVYGDAHADSVAGRAPSKTATANYPASYASERERLQCERLRHEREAAKLDAAIRNWVVGADDGTPAYCAKY